MLASRWDDAAVLIQAMAFEAGITLQIETLGWADSLAVARLIVASTAEVARHFPK